MWEDYLSRVERVLESKIEPRQIQLLPYPSRRSLRQETENLSIDIIDFLSLLDCELNQVIGTRNSSLGKVMPASQRWLYEVELINALDDCIRLLGQQEEPPEVFADLKRFERIKRSELPIVVWNATFAGPEFQDFLSSKGGPLDTDFQFAYFGDLSTALAQLSQWAGNPMFPGKSGEYEKVNQQLVTYPLYGRLLQSMLEATSMLEAVTTTLRDKMAERPICLVPKPTQKATIMRNVLINIYNVRVQPYIAEISKAHTEWSSALIAIGEGLPVDLLGSYYGFSFTSRPESIHDQFKTASVAHARAWTELLEQCGLRPGRS